MQSRCADHKICKESACSLGKPHIKIVMNTSGNDCNKFWCETKQEYKHCIDMIDEWDS